MDGSHDVLEEPSLMNESFNKIFLEKFTDEIVEKNGNIIKSHGPSSSLQFSLAIATALIGPRKANMIDTS